MLESQKKKNSCQNSWKKQQKKKKENSELAKSWRIFKTLVDKIRELRD